MCMGAIAPTLVTGCRRVQSGKVMQSYLGLSVGHRTKEHVTLSYLHITVIIYSKAIKKLCGNLLCIVYVLASELQ